MKYKILEVGGKEYKLKFSILAFEKAEKAIGGSIFTALRSWGGDNLPSVSDMVTLFYCSLMKYQRKTSKEDAEEIMEAYLDEGGSLMDFFNIIFETFSESGLLPKDEDEDNEVSESKDTKSEEE
jgi:hypothetical protein